METSKEILYNKAGVQLSEEENRPEKTDGLDMG